MTDPLAVAPHSGVYVDDKGARVMTRDEQLCVSEILIREFATKIAANPKKADFVKHWANQIMRECDSLLEAIRQKVDPNAHLGAVEGERKEAEK